MEVYDEVQTYQTERHVGQNQHGTELEQEPPNALRLPAQFCTKRICGIRMQV